MVWRGGGGGVIVYNRVGDRGGVWFGCLKGVSCGWCCDCPALGFQIEFVISLNDRDLSGGVGLEMVRLSE